MSRDREPAWARIDVDYFRNPKVAALDDDEVVAHLKLILWAKEQGTNGHVPRSIPDEVLSKLRSRRTRTRVLTSLESASLLHAEPDGWTLNGFDERNGDEASRQAAREYERSRKAAQRKGSNVP